jgi:predicted RNA-binding protein YlqC (UPF0109 family)
MTDMAQFVPEKVESEADSHDARVREMLLAVLRSLVNEEDKLEIATVSEEGGAAFQVQAADSDIGKLIGKSGRTARAMRIILGAAAAKHGRRYTLDIGPPRS